MSKSCPACGGVLYQSGEGLYGCEECDNFCTAQLWMNLPWDSPPQQQRPVFSITDELGLNAEPVTIPRGTYVTGGTNPMHVNAYWVTTEEATHEEW